MFSRSFQSFNQGNDVSQLESLIDRNEFEKAKQLLEKLAKNPKSDYFKLSFMLYVNKINKSEIYSSYLDKLIEILKGCNTPDPESTYLPLVMSSSNDDDHTRITWKLNFKCFNLKNLVFGFSEVGPDVEKSNDIFIIRGLKFVRSVLSKTIDGNFKKTQLLKCKENDDKGICAEFITITHETSKLFLFYLNSENKHIYLYK